MPRYLSHDERITIQRDIDEVDDAVRQARDAGDHYSLLVALEKGLFLRKRMYSEESEQVLLATQRLVESCNHVATAMLQAGNLKVAGDLLGRAKELRNCGDIDRAVTYNNIACCLRRSGKLRSALKYLNLALQLEEGAAGADTSQTHLNLCATLSQLGRHQEAMMHAQMALIKLYEDVTTPLVSSGAEPDVAERASILCIAYHNLAVEHEYLKNFKAAERAYASGLRWAQAYLGADHQVFQLLNKSLGAVRQLSSSSKTRRRGPAVDTQEDRSTTLSRTGASNDFEGVRDHFPLPPTGGGSYGPHSELVTPRGSRPVSGQQARSGWWTQEPICGTYFRQSEGGSIALEAVDIAHVQGRQFRWTEGTSAWGLLADAREGVFQVAPDCPYHRQGFTVLQLEFLDGETAFEGPDGCRYVRQDAEDGDMEQDDLGDFGR